MNFKNQNSFAIFYIQFIKQFSTGYKQFSTSVYNNKKYGVSKTHRIVVYMLFILLQFSKRFLYTAYSFDYILIACCITHSEAFRCTE